MTRQSRKSLRARSGHGITGQPRRKLGQMIRRLRISASSGARWVLKGVSDFDSSIETENAESFDGIGFAARPKAGHNAEAITVKVGGESGHPVIVATRSRDVVRGLFADHPLSSNVVGSGNTWRKSSRRKARWCSVAFLSIHDPARQA